MARSYPSRRFPGGPWIEPQVTPALRGPKRTGPIGELVPGDDVEVARILARRGFPPLKQPISYSWKLTGDLEADNQVTSPVDGFAVLPVPYDVALLHLIYVELSCSTVSSDGNTVVNLRHIYDDPDLDTEDMLAVPITVLEGEKHSWKCDDDELPEFDLNFSQMERGDEIAIDFDEVGVDTRGWTIHFWYR